MVQKKLVPPDGGWGWTIMIAYAIFYSIYVPIVQNFGLIFKDALTSLNLPVKDGAFVLTLNSAVSMLMGFVNGPLLRRFTYRKIAIVGAIFVVSGILSTIFCTTLTHFIITYGLIASAGVGFARGAYPLALNYYFLKKRTRASGFAYTLTGLASVLIPHLISYTMENYGYKGTLLIIGGISANNFVAAFLLQPVEWHMKEEIVETKEEDNENDFPDKGQDFLTIERKSSIRRDSITSMLKMYSINEPMVTTLQLTESTLLFDFEHSPMRRNKSSPSINRLTVDSGPLEKQRRFSSPVAPSKMTFSPMGGSLRRLSSSNQIISTIDEDIEMNKVVSETPLMTTSVYASELSIKHDKPSRLKRFLNDIVTFFDLTLLNDPIYVNIMIGMSFAIFAELNFSLLTPFILTDIGLETSEIATFISVTSIADLISRMVTPFIGEYLNKTTRTMYLFSLVLLTISRYTVTLSSDYETLLGIGVFLGIAKGVRTVYWLLVIPDYVPIERLAAASSLQMIVNGILIFLGGPFFGFIKDVTGSFVYCVYVINLMTSVTIVCWLSEMVYIRLCKKRTASTEIK